MKDLKIFIKGETIDLCKPTIKFAKESSWYSWFNKDYIVRYLSHHYKEKNNTPKKQVEFLRSSKKNRFKAANLKKVSKDLSNHFLAFQIEVGTKDMPSWFDVLTEDEIWDLTHYLHDLAVKKQ